MLESAASAKYQNKLWNKGFFSTPQLNKQRKTKLHLQFPSVHLKKQKTQQIQSVIFKLEFPLRYYFLAFPPQCPFSLSVLSIFCSRNSTQSHQALALPHRDWADPFWELECARKERAGTHLLYCWLCTHMVWQLIGSSNKQGSSLNSFFKLQVNSTQVIQASHKILAERVIKIPIAF